MQPKLIGDDLPVLCPHTHLCGTDGPLQVILVHFQLPFQAGLVGHPWSDPGCSVVVFFELKELRHAHRPAVALFQNPM